MVRHGVQVLRAGGKRLRRIAAETGISLRSVKRIVHESAIEQPGDVASALERGVGWPSVVEAIEEEVLDQATAAATIAELETEIQTLRGLEEQAKRVRLSGLDTKSKELSAVLDDPLMTDEHGARTASPPWKMLARASTSAR